MLDPKMYPSTKDMNENPQVTRVRRYSVSFTAASVAANVVAAQDITATGVLAGDVIIGMETPANSVATGVVGARVKSDNTIEVRFVNPTAGALVPTAGTYDFLVATYA